jgi:hypothetical protein
MIFINAILNLMVVLYTAILFLMSIPLGIFACMYSVVRRLFRYTLIFDGVILIISLLLSLTDSETALVSYINASDTYFHTHSISEYIMHQINNFSFIHHKFLLVLLFPLALIHIVSLILNMVFKKRVTKNANDKVFEGVELAAESKIGQIPDNELNQHTLIVGTTGSGKTTTLMNFAVSCAKRNIPLIFLDGKGSADLIDKLSTIAHTYQRKFRVFTLRPRENITNIAGYNPFANGNATEWKNRIMSLFAEVTGRGQEHFSLAEQNYINFVATILAELPTKIDLRSFLAFLENPDKLLAIAHTTNPEIAKKLAKLNDDNDLHHKVGDVVKLLELFAYSDYGYLFNTLDMENVINIKESILNNEIILFQFDASSYPEDSRKIAKMVISDINSAFAGFNQFTKCYCIFDEFASYASSNLAETISLHRSNGMHAVIGTQSIETVKLKSSDTKRVAEELIACCNTYITHGINHYNDAEIMAKIMGVRPKQEVSNTINKNSSEELLSQHVKTVDKYKIEPKMIMELTTGEAVVYRKISKLAPTKIKVQSIKFD